MALIFGLTSTAATIITVVAVAIIYAIVKHTTIALLKLLSDNGVVWEGRPPTSQSRIAILITIFSLAILITLLK